MRTFIKTSFSKKTGKPYTALYVESINGYPVIVTFDKLTMNKISSDLVHRSILTPEVPYYLDEE